MESFLRYIVPSCLFIGAMVWVGVEYTGLGSEGTELEARSSTCVTKSSAGDTACSTVVAAVLASVDDDSQGTRSAVAASTPQAVVSSEFELGGALGGFSRADTEDADGSLAGDFIEVDEGAAYGDGEPEYIGEFIDPDAENFGIVAGEDNPVMIGEFIDPDGDLSLSFDVEQNIGAFINPDTGEAVGDGENVGK